jgi:hypothetical protein
VKVKVISSIYFLLLIGLPNFTSATSLGVHCWLQKPENHILCFEVNDINGKYYSLNGEDISETTSEDISQTVRYPVAGSALFDETKQVYRLEFTQNQGSIYVYENTITLNTTDLSGNWTDDKGNEGEFQYLGTGPLDPDQIKTLTKPRAKRKK